MGKIIFTGRNKIFILNGIFNKINSRFKWNVKGEEMWPMPP